MLKLYTSPGSISSRKAKSWFKDHEIPYEEKNIFKISLEEKEVREILQRSENGTDDIISKRSKVFKESNLDIESMSLNQLISFIQANPSVLKRPIMMDEKRFQVGYNTEEIRSFIPRGNQMRTY
ncbi:MAG: transcriptional regulator Spx [bacterium]